ncbi:hypothetical protein Q8A73_011623 [Channa argus]|nr:hypothetical protein Q8A73_011623 [Channa argus]
MGQPSRLQEQCIHTPSFCIFGVAEVSLRRMHCPQQPQGVRRALWHSAITMEREPYPQSMGEDSIWIRVCLYGPTHMKWLEASILRGKVARGLGLRKWPNPPTLGRFLCFTLDWFLFKCGSGVRKPNVTSLQHGVPKAEKKWSVECSADSQKVTQCVKAGGGVGGGGGGISIRPWTIQDLYLPNMPSVLSLSM